ncbi:Charged multivesicular body protein 7 like protein [Argiope bruennichi]|uniref:Charged multivesicular body protein 7 n=1 Tax=Argiope bruennichi TaxID=94029 RepID=A0A8T0E8H2_ARGBR|nr:Charged multivesicular body protein 7 like protein [Argiope bruennichi]
MVVELDMPTALVIVTIERSDFPIDWNDDIRMNFLFSPFRERSVNPEGYDAKINFWINTIQDLCMKSQCPVISNTALCAAFDRKNRQPVCLDIVLENMMRESSQLSVVKDLSAKILKRYYELIDTKWTDNAVFLEHLRQECKDICSESNFELAVMQLQREKIASVFEEYGEKVIKFRKFEEKKIEPLSEIDKGVLSLKRARDTILDDMDALETSILSCEEEAKNLVKKGFKSKAMLSLKKKKRLETLLKKKSIAFDNIENLLCQLKNTGTEKMVLEAYRTGVQAMKRTTTGELDLDNIDVVMSDVQGVLEDYNEVQSTLSKSVTADDSLEEFEEELENLIAEDKSPVKEKRRKESTPRVNDDELLKRLEALRAPPEDISPIKKPKKNGERNPLRAPKIYLKLFCMISVVAFKYHTHESMECFLM